MNTNEVFSHKSAEIELLEMIRNSSCPSKAYEEAIKVIASYLEQHSAANEQQ